MMYTLRVIEAYIKSTDKLYVIVYLATLIV